MAGSIPSNNDVIHSVSRPWYPRRDHVKTTPWNGSLDTIPVGSLRELGFGKSSGDSCEERFLEG
jgi:hypothetical protein